MSNIPAPVMTATLSRIGPVALAVTTNLKRLSVSEVGCYSGDVLVSHATVTYSIPA